MKIKNVLVEASRNVFYNQKFVLLLWGTNALLALILAIPVFSLLSTDLNHSLISDALMQKFDYVWLIQFYHKYQLQINQIPFSLYGVVLIYILLNTFYAGGLISVFNTPNKNSWSDFFFGGVRTWRRFVKVLLITLAFYAVLFSVYQITEGLLDSSPSYSLIFFYKLFRYVFLIFFIGVITIISDYTRIALAVSERPKVLPEIISTTKFLFSNFTKTFGTFFIVALFGAAGVIFYNLIGAVIPYNSLYFLFIFFILQQILIIFRINIRMLFFASEIILCKDLKAEILEEVEIIEGEE